MVRLIGQRLAGALLTLLVLSVLLFLGLRLLPGDPATAMLGQRATPELVARIRHDFGLDQSLPAQYWTYLTRMLSGNFGYSLATTGTTGAVGGMSVGSIIIGSLKVTLPLSLLGIFFAALLGVALGAVGASSPRSKRDAAVSGASLLGLALPDFFVAFLLVLVFTVHLGWLPSIGYTDIFSDPAGGLRSLTLPIATLAIINAGPIARMTRSALLETLSTEYVLYARARGVPGSVVLLKHALRNGMIPILTVTGLQLGYLLGGVVVVESVFGLPGMGRALLLAVSQRDYPTIEGLVLTFAAAFILLNLMTDLMYASVDPRARSAA